MKIHGNGAGGTVKVSSNIHATAKPASAAVRVPTWRIAVPVWCAPHRAVFRMLGR